MLQLYKQWKGNSEKRQRIEISIENIEIQGIITIFCPNCKKKHELEPKLQNIKVNNTMVSKLNMKSVASSN